MQLRVLTLNVWGLPWGLARDRTARMRAIGERLPDLDADVIAFQEVWAPAAREQLIDAGHAAGYEAIWHREQALGGSGLLVLSRHPIARASFTPFTLRGLPQRLLHADFYGGKGFAVLTLSMPDGPVHVVATHLHAGYVPEGASDEYQSLRVAQAVEIAAAIRRIDGPLVALGDWNFGESDPEYAVLAGLTGMTEGAAALDVRAPTLLGDHPYRPLGSASERIDMVFARPGEHRRVRFDSIERVLAEPIKIGGRRGAYSDHTGLLAVLRVEAGALGESETPGPRLDPAALDLADEWLRIGLDTARTRRSRERGLAAAGFTLGAAAGASALRGRRAFVRGGLASLAGLALGSSGAFAWLSECFVADELERYAQIQGLIGALRGELD
jgi:sphingomyelin phosphodiesterase 2